MFSQDIHSLRMDPDEHVAVRPFVEIESVGYYQPPIRQYYFSKQDGGIHWSPGTLLSNVADEKVEGLQWRVVKRWFHVPVFQLSFSNDLTDFIDTKGRAPMPGDGPYVAMFRQALQKIRTEYDNNNKNSPLT